jgi:glycosyltransferase involved in cell wall biosynthesis
LRPHINKASNEEGEPDFVSYLNVPGIREHLLARAFAASARGIVKWLGTPAYVVSYNTTAQALAVGSFCQALGAKWFSVVADLPTSSRGAREFWRRSGSADGLVVLSAAAYREGRHTNVLHLDGGVSRLPTPEDRNGIEPNTVLYSGALNRFGGVATLLKAWALVNKPNSTLWVCGKGGSPEIERAARLDRRIKLLGAVSEQDLHRLSQKATVFVNPRPANLPESHFNFPSKVLQYMSYGKPVVSTWTPGLSEEYREILIVTKGDSPEALADSLSAALSLPAESLEHIGDETARFLRSRLWTIQATRLTSWASLGGVK